MRRAHLFSLLLVLAMAGCGTAPGQRPGSSRPAPADATPDQPAPTTPAAGQPAPTAPSAVQPGPLDPQLSNAMNDFGFKLFQSLVEQEAGKNVVISPTSVALALSMTLNGAAGETQQAMARALGVEQLALDELNQASAALTDLLSSADPQVQLEIANALYARQGMPFKPDFLQRNRQFYGAEVSELDFDSPNAPTIINSWVAEKTHDKIESIINGRISPDTVLFLINALYFKGAWTNSFDTQQTREQDFTLLDGRTKQQPMMSQERAYRYFKGDGVEVVALPYGQGQTSMLIVLPDAGSSLQDLVGQLDRQRWEGWMRQLSEQELMLMFPRFKVEYEASLIQSLEQRGMGIAFGSAADFSEMIEAQVYIKGVAHKTFIEVNEQGTEAAAVTTVEVGIGSIAIPRSMVVDRPFLFAIREERTGALLFMGSIVDPQ